MKLTPYTPANTSVMLLAAGQGQRMRPLSETTPKPLLKIGKRTLIEHHLCRLSDFGFQHIVINTAYLGTMIQEQLGNGTKYNLTIEYSDESKTGALETAGGIVKALPKIQSDPFLVINSDIWTDFDFTLLLDPLDKLARIVLVENPAHNLSGDFCLNKSGIVKKRNTQPAGSATFSGIALYHKSIFSKLPIGKRPLLPILDSLITQRELCGILYRGIWNDIGTPERLEAMNRTLTD